MQYVIFQCIPITITRRRLLKTYDSGPQNKKIIKDQHIKHRNTL